MNEQIIAWAGSILLSIGVVWKLVEKFSPKIKRALRITEDVTKLLNDVIAATEDGNISTQEVEKVLQSIKELQEELK